MKRRGRIAVIGGGASGIAAAVTAARLGAQVVVLERLDRIGKKILATGNGRCNLGNQNAFAEHYYTRNRKQLESLMKPMKPEGILRFFKEMGLLCDIQEDGKVYPYCYQASMVLDVLRNALVQLGVEIECSFEVNQIIPRKGGYEIYAKDGRSITADQVILAAGGQASPKLGSNGSGLSLAKALGHHVNPVYPCLVPLKGKNPYLSGLKGIRAQCRVSLYRGDRMLQQDTGEILFTEYGVSGIPAMQLSCRMGMEGKAQDLWLGLDFFPHMEWEQVTNMLFSRRKEFSDQTLEQYLLGTVNKKIAYGVLKSAGAAPLSRMVSSLSDREVKNIAGQLKNWKVELTGTLSWDQAQVMGGGVRLDEVLPGTMESTLCPGLYLTGELLDAAGECGGFNLHWAWWTGILAGKAAAQFGKT
jgi:predicted Rossmann fold flavoprotein